MSELVTADKWLYSVLNGDAALKALTPKVYALPAPQGAVLPYTAYNVLSALDLQGMGARRVWVNALYVVRAIFESASWGGDLEVAADRIDTLLHAASGSASGGMVWSCARQEPFYMVDNSSGQQIRMLGGIYRIHVT